MMRESLRRSAPRLTALTHCRVRKHDQRVDVVHPLDAEPALVTLPLLEHGLEVARLESEGGVSGSTRVKSRGMDAVAAHSGEKFPRWRIRVTAAEYC
jgi:hypothetical protein